MRNILFVIMTSNHEYQEMRKDKFNWDSPYLGFYDKSLFPKHTKFLRIIYNACHQMFTASDGNSKFPFHILFADSIQANNASKTMAEILKRLGINSSLSTVKEHMDLVTSNKNVKQICQ